MEDVALDPSLEIDVMGMGSCAGVSLCKTSHLYWEYHVV